MKEFDIRMLILILKIFLSNLVDIMQWQLALKQSVLFQFCYNVFCKN